MTRWQTVVVVVIDIFFCLLAFFGGVRSEQNTNATELVVCFGLRLSWFVVSPPRLKFICQFFPPLYLLWLAAFPQWSTTKDHIAYHPFMIYYVPVYQT